MGITLSAPLQSSYTQDPPVAYPGQLRIGGPRRVVPAKQAEASASMPYGTPCAFKPSGATSDLDVTIPANSTDVIKGILYRADGYSPSWTSADGTFGELDSTGIRPGTLLDLLQIGSIYVKCHTGCAPGDRLFVAYATGAQYAAVGQMGNVTGASQTIDCTKQGLWESTAAADGFAWLTVNFQSKP